MTNLKDEINKLTVITPRIQKRKNEYHNARPTLCAQRAWSLTKSFQETEGFPTPIRRAKAFARVMDESHIVIREGELIVGSFTKYLRGGEFPVEHDPYDFLRFLQEGRFEATSEVVIAEVPEEELVLLKEVANYWVGKSTKDIVHAAWKQACGEECFELLDGGSRVIGGVSDLSVRAASVFNPKIIREGFNSIISRTKAKREELKNQKGRSILEAPSIWHRIWVLDGIIMACEATIRFAKRHAELAKELASKESNSIRKKELEEIAQICEWVPANPARTFHEALQSFWFTHLALMKEEPFPGGHCLGRIDQWLYPFFEAELSEGKLTLQQAGELLGLLWIKLNELESIRDYITSRSAAGSLLQQATIGGKGNDGADKTNVLSYLILEVTRQIGMPQPGVYIRWNPETDRDFMRKAVETNRDTHGGLPAFLNDIIAIKSLLAKGVAYEDSVEWSGAGCLFYLVGNCQMAPKVLACLNDAKVFEITLYNGLDPRTGKQVGLKTGDPRKFSSIEDLFEAWERQYIYFVDKMMEITTAGMAAMLDRYACPLTSALVDDCIEKGLDVFEGGERYPHLQYMYQHRGHVDVADSFAAIKKLVFEDKKITMDQLLVALSSNFGGEHDFIRSLCLKAPKYGNDDDYVDEIFNRISLTTNKILLDKGRQWEIERIGRPALTLHYYHGQVVGALPNGRKAYMPLCDAALSPMQGFDLNGPTALINSATKVNHHPPEMNGIILNMKVSPSLLVSPEQIEKFIKLIEVFFERGGWHIQFNIIDRQTLLNAQKYPEQYRNLMVRVAGYSAYFVDLPRDVQNEIIARTEHGV